MRNLLCRSLLFTPADRLSAIKKALTLRTLDVVVIDLEDAVSIAAKESTRDGLCTFLSTLERPYPYPKVMVRVNCPATTSWGTLDLEALVPLKSHFDAVLIPKVETSETISFVANKLQRTGPHPTLWCMIESARGVEDVHVIGKHQAVQGLVFGSNDYTKDIRAQMTSDRSQLWYALSRVVNAARAEGMCVGDGVFMELDDDGTKLDKETRHGRALGFDGKTIIHPKQLSVVNSVFSPDEAEIAYAQSVCEAFSEASRQGKGVCVLHGKLIEALHFDQARQTLELFESIKDRR